MNSVLKKPYFYDAQFKRLIIQLISLFTGYQVRTGTLRDGKEHYRDVPVIFGDFDRVVAYLLSPRGDQDNSVAYLPVMSLYITGIQQADDYRLSPQHVEEEWFVSVGYNDSGEVEPGKPGKRKTVSRAMPVPYRVNFELAIWASSNDEMFQILEQILAVFNPDVELQMSNSPHDWTFLTTVRFDGRVTSERVSSSSGGLPTTYVSTLSFDTILWLSIPAQVKETKLIYNVDVVIRDLERKYDLEGGVMLDGLVVRANEGDISFFESLSWDLQNDPEQENR